MASQTFSAFSQALMDLAHGHQVTTRQFHRRLTLIYSDGNDEAGFVHEPRLLRQLAEKGVEATVTASFRRFQAMDGARSAVINGFRRFVFERGECLERSETGVWRCGRADQWQFFFMDYRLTQRIEDQGAEGALAHLVGILGGKAELCEEPLTLSDIPFPAETFGVVSGQLPSVEEIMRKLCAKQPGLIRVVEGINQLASTLVKPREHVRSHAEAVLPPPLTPEQGLAYEHRALCLINAFKQDPYHFNETPHWADLWRAHCANAYWIRPEVDLWAPRVWWLEVGRGELARTIDADALSAYELMLSRGEFGCRESARLEMEQWHALGVFDPDTYYYLLSFFYPEHDLARQEFDREEDCLSWRKEKALILARHYPTLRRVALQFKDQWEACLADGGLLEDDWVLEHDSFRYMGPTWAVSFLGMEQVCLLHETCCRAASRLDWRRLREMSPHLVCWAADFLWPDVLSQLRSNEHFPKVLAADEKHLPLYALAWSLVRPDAFVRRMAALLLEADDPLRRFAGAIAWLRCSASRAKPDTY